MPDTNELRDDLIAQAEQLFTGLSAEDRDKLRGDFQVIRDMLQALADSHPPSILVLGDPCTPIKDLLQNIAPLAERDVESYRIHEDLGRGRWQEWALTSGVIKVCDAREESPHQTSIKALHYQTPELILSAVASNSKGTGRVAELCRILESVEDLSDDPPPAALIAICRSEQGREVGDFVTLQAIKQDLVEVGKSRDYFQVVQLSREGKLLKATLAELPEASRFGLARIASNTEAKRAMADSVVRAATSINASIAVVPIPLGSSLPITSVQVLMITAIAWLSGREVTAKTLAEFATALGLNLGAAIALREFARALINWIPVAGSLVSAAIAAGATQTLGRAAIRYYIDGEDNLS